jgi:hypothetical protein
VLVLAAMGRFTLWGAVLVDVGTALAVIANSLLLLRKRLRPGGSRNGGGVSCVAECAAAKATDGGQDGSCCADTGSRGCSPPGDGQSSTCCSTRSPAPTATRAPRLDNSCQPGCSSCPVSAGPKAAVQAGSGCRSSKRCGSSSARCHSSAATATAGSTAPGCCKSPSCSSTAAAMQVVDAGAPATVPCCQHSGHSGIDAQS